MLRKLQKVTKSAVNSNTNVTAVAAHRKPFVLPCCKPRILCNPMKAARSVAPANRQNGSFGSEKQGPQYACWQSYHPACWDASAALSGFDWKSLVPSSAGGRGTVVDVGGSDGTFGLGLSRPHLELKVIVQDLPSCHSGRAD